MMYFFLITTGLTVAMLLIAKWVLWRINGSRSTLILIALSTVYFLVVLQLSQFILGQTA